MPLALLHANRREGWVPYLRELPCLSEGESPAPLALLHANPLHANRREGWVPYLRELPCLSEGEAPTPRDPLHQTNLAECSH